MSYQPLEKLFHKDLGAERSANVEAEYRSRFGAPSTFRIGYATSAGELFVCVPTELTFLHAEVLSDERDSARLLAALPPIAQDAILRSFVLDDVVSTNEIEGVHSSRRQIKDALDAAGRPRGKVKRDVRFREYALLYDNILTGAEIPLDCPGDVRRIYDRVTLGEIAAADQSDGVLFRAQGVDIVGPGSRILHKGLEPESAVVEAVEEMLRVSKDPGLPPLVRSLVAHYLFEYAHPFYDGNGRTGRFLLTLMLSKHLTLPTVFSLSRTLLGNRAAYYRAFRDAEEPLNRGELTFFVQSMLRLIKDAQGDACARLEEASEAYRDAEAVAARLRGEGLLRPKEAQVVLLLMQYEAFGLFGTASIREIADFLGVQTQMARKHVKLLEEKGVCEVRNKYDPVTFGLTRQFVEKHCRP